MLRRVALVGRWLGAAAPGAGVVVLVVVVVVVGRRRGRVSVGWIAARRAVLLVRGLIVAGRATSNGTLVA
jgi:hypothetical protein